MKRITKLTLLLAISTFVMGFGFSGNTETNATVKGCEILHQGTFKYMGIKKMIRVVIDGENHTEYHNDGKYFIKSKLNWINDCEYNMIMEEITIPNFPYGPGDVMNVKINKVRRKTIFYTATVKDLSWDGKMKKIG